MSKWRILPKRGEPLWSIWKWECILFTQFNWWISGTASSLFSELFCFPSHSFRNGNLCIIVVFLFSFVAFEFSLLPAEYFSFSSSFLFGNNSAILSSCPAGSDFQVKWTLRNALPDKGSFCRRSWAWTWVLLLEWIQKSFSMTRTSMIPVKRVSSKLKEWKSQLAAVLITIWWVSFEHFTHTCSCWAASVWTGRNSSAFPSTAACSPFSEKQLSLNFMYHKAVVSRLWTRTSPWNSWYWAAEKKKRPTFFFNVFIIRPFFILKNYWILSTTSDSFLVHVKLFSYVLGIHPHLAPS